MRIFQQEEAEEGEGEELLEIEGQQMEIGEMAIPEEVKFYSILFLFSKFTIFT